MVPILLLCMMLLQSASPTATKPLIDNDRVSVLDVSDYSTSAQPNAAVVVSLSGSAVYVPKGATSKITGRLFVIDLKDHPVSPIENKSGYPLAFPRPGIK